MKKIIIIITIILTLTIGIIYETFNIYKTLTSKSDINGLTEVSVNTLKENKNLAIMVQEKGSNQYTPMESRDAWPDYPNYVFIKAECDDGTGSKLVGTNVVNYDEQSKKLSMTVKTTLYCTLYFAATNDVFSLLELNGGETFKKAFNGDTMHRFIGTYEDVLNNYICFGTVNQGDCVENKSDYMYRIIGITDISDEKTGLKTNQLKIIKAIPWQDVSWGSNDDWEIKSYNKAVNVLNETFYNSIDEAWKNKITIHKWYKGNSTSETSTTEPTSLTTGKLGDIQ